MHQLTIGMGSFIHPFMHLLLYILAVYYKWKSGQFYKLIKEPKHMHFPHLNIFRSTLPPYMTSIKQLHSVIFHGHLSGQKIIAADLKLCQFPWCSHHPVCLNQQPIHKCWPYFFYDSAMAVNLFLCTVYLFIKFSKIHAHCFILQQLHQCPDQK